MEHLGLPTVKIAAPVDVGPGHVRVDFTTVGIRLDDVDRRLILETLLVFNPARRGRWKARWSRSTLLRAR